MLACQLPITCAQPSRCPRERYHNFHIRISTLFQHAPSLIAIATASYRNLHTDVVSLNGSLWGSESQSNVLVPSSSSLADSCGLRLRLAVEEDVRLLLESALRLDGKFGGHDCGFVGCRSRNSWKLSCRCERKSLVVVVVDFPSLFPRLQSLWVM